MKNTFWENIFVSENFLSTVKKPSCRENIRFLVGLRKMLRLYRKMLRLYGLYVNAKVYRKDKTKWIVPLDLAQLRV